jgi:hypothetical protein
MVCLHVFQNGCTAFTRFHLDADNCLNTLNSHLIKVCKQGYADTHLYHRTAARVEVKEKVVEMQVQEHGKKLSP